MIRGGMKISDSSGHGTSLDMADGMEPGGGVGHGRRESTCMQTNEVASAEAEAISSIVPKFGTDVGKKEDGNNCR